MIVFAAELCHGDISVNTNFFLVSEGYFGGLGFEGSDSGPK